MKSSRLMSLVVLAFSLANARAEVPSKIDFARDVQPLLRSHCIECHGPDEQKNGFRLDRRRDAMRGGTGTVIGPGSSASSRLYLRLIGNRYGQQMPPDEPLSAEQIKIVKDWIDQGVSWPDELSGEAPSPPPDPLASRLTAALRDGDQPTFQKLLKDNPAAGGRKGPHGSTPLMYACLYGDGAAVRLLLASGADPSVRNEAGATALMWALDDLEKTRLLLEIAPMPKLARRMAKLRCSSRRDALERAT